MISADSCTPLDLFTRLSPKDGDDGVKLHGSDLASVPPQALRASVINCAFDSSQRWMSGVRISWLKLRDRTLLHPKIHQATSNIARWVIGPLALIGGTEDVNVHGLDSDLTWRVRTHHLHNASHSHPITVLR